MKFLNGVTLLLVYQLTGEILVRLLGLPIPGPVLGMVMLFVTLMIRGSAPDSLSEASSALLSHLSLLFVPAGVGIVAHLGALREHGLGLAVALVVSTMLAIVVGAAAFVAVAKLTRSDVDD